MKTIAAAIALVLAAMAQAPPKQKSTAPASPSVKCRNADGRACTSRQVQALVDAVFAGKSQHEVLLPVKDLTLASSDGTLKCQQSDGTACTTPQLDAVKEIAAGQQLFLNYNASKSNTRN